MLEAEPEDRQRPGSRAIYLHRETLAFWDSINAGLGAEIAAHGITWSAKRTYWRGDLVYEKTYPPGDPSKPPPFTSLPQVVTERLLFDACKAAGVEFVWGRPVTAVETAPGGVTIHAGGGEPVRAPYLIAADGARSAVRQSLGIAMSGSRSENHFVIVDIAEDDDRPLPPARIFHYEHPAVEGRNVLLVPFAGGWRADLQCRPTDDPAHFNDEQGVRRWIAQVLPAYYADRVTWISTYQFLQVVADRFTDDHRRVLLAGEAAHLFAPFGARGLNSGVPDAIAAATARRHRHAGGGRRVRRHPAVGGRVQPRRRLHRAASTCRRGPCRCGSSGTWRPSARGAGCAPARGSTPRRTARARRDRSSDTVY